MHIKYTVDLICLLAFIEGPRAHYQAESGQAAFKNFISSNASIYTVKRCNKTACQSLAQECLNRKLQPPSDMGLLKRTPDRSQLPWVTARSLATHLSFLLYKHFKKKSLSKVNAFCSDGLSPGNQKCSTLLITEKVIKQ